MPLNKKPMTQTRTIVAHETIMALSKAALADLVVDLLRRSEGEDLDGEPLAKAFVEAYGPIAVARGERPPTVWKKKSVKNRSAHSLEDMRTAFSGLGCK